MPPRYHSNALFISAQSERGRLFARPSRSPSSRHVAGRRGSRPACPAANVVEIDGFTHSFSARGGRRVCRWISRNSSCTATSPRTSRSSRRLPLFPRGGFRSDLRAPARSLPGPVVYDRHECAGGHRRPPVVSRIEPGNSAMLVVRSSLASRGLPGQCVRGPRRGQRKQTFALQPGDVVYVSNRPWARDGRTD